MKPKKNNLASTFGVNALKLAASKDFNEYSVKNISSNEVKGVWNYAGKISEAREILVQICKHRDRISQVKVKEVNDVLSFSRNRRESQVKRNFSERRHFVSRIEKALRPSDYKNYQYGTWDSTPKCFKINETTVAEIKWSCESDWNYYSKGYGRPKNKISNRGVNFSTFNHATATYTHVFYSIETFAGNFLEKAIAQFFKAEHVKVEKSLLPIQLNSIFSIELLRTIGGISLYKRKIGTLNWDFSWFDGANTYHDSSIEKALKGFKEKKVKLEKGELERKEAENVILNCDIVIAQYGFCKPGVSEFCEQNDLDINASYTVKELRNYVLKKRDVNCKFFKTELQQIGISLNCK